MVEVFKTNVQRISQANRLIALLRLHFPDFKINFDLMDCDKILRVEGVNLVTEKIAVLVMENGFTCKALEE